MAARSRGGFHEVWNHLLSSAPSAASSNVPARVSGFPRLRGSRSTPDTDTNGLSSRRRRRSPHQPLAQKPVHHTPRLPLLALVLLAPACTTSRSTRIAKQDPKAQTPAAKTQDEDLAMQLANPVADLISVPIQTNVEFGKDAGDPDRTLVNLQPVVPFALTEEWNLVTRTIVPWSYVDVVGGNDPVGLGDVVQSFFFAPRAPLGGWILGGGPVFLYPTATDDRLGADQWGMGPTAVALRQEGPVSYGALANHIWSLGGETGPNEVNATLLNPFVSYVTQGKTTLALGTEATYDWTGEQWTTPVNATVSQLLVLGGQPLQLSLGGRYYADAPDNGPEWGLRFGVVFLF